MSRSLAEDTLAHLQQQHIVHKQSIPFSVNINTLQSPTLPPYNFRLDPHNKILLRLSTNNYYYGQLLELKEATCSKCIYIFQNGAFYQGPINKGKFQGKGQLIKYSSDFKETMSFYKGEWSNGKPHGKGKQFILNSMTYEGSFLEGRKNGKGKIVYKDGSYYEGYFLNNEIEGQGLYKTGGHQWKGVWKQGYLQGQGQQISFGNNQLDEDNESQSCYYGMFQRGQKQGKGVYKWGHNFSEYSGNFEKGQLNGQGRFRLRDSEYVGHWKKGVQIQLNSASKIQLKKIKKKETISSLILNMEDIEMEQK